MRTTSGSPHRRQAADLVLGFPTMNRYEDISGLMQKIRGQGGDEKWPVKT
jgi:hypothetical protein